MFSRIEQALGSVPITKETTLIYKQSLGHPHIKEQSLKGCKEQSRVTKSRPAIKPLGLRTAEEHHSALGKRTPDNNGKVYTGILKIVLAIGSVCCTNLSSA